MAHRGGKGPGLTPETPSLSNEHYRSKHGCGQHRPHPCSVFVPHSVPLIAERELIFPFQCDILPPPQGVIQAIGSGYHEHGHRTAHRKGTLFHPGQRVLQDPVPDAAGGGDAKPGGLQRKYGGQHHAGRLQPGFPVRRRHRQSGIFRGAAVCPVHRQRPGRAGRPVLGPEPPRPRADADGHRPQAGGDPQRSTGGGLRPVPGAAALPVYRLGGDCGGGDQVPVPAPVDLCPVHPHQRADGGPAQRGHCEHLLLRVGGLPARQRGH